MASFPTVRVAAIQATPVILDADACIDKAGRLLHDAADAGAQLAVLPECFVPLYPLFADCDLRDGLHAKRWFDAVGHYSREEILLEHPARRGGATLATDEPLT